MSDFICHGKANPNPKTSAAEPRATNAPLSLLKVFNEKDRVRKSYGALERGDGPGTVDVGWWAFYLSAKYSDVKEHVCVRSCNPTPLPMEGD